jgi:carbon storage regulator
MLVLSRKLNEKIVIDGGIVVTIVKIEGGQVRVGIEAPEHVKIRREELLDKSQPAQRPGSQALASAV